MFRSEGIRVGAPSWPDNRECVELVGGRPHGVLAALDAEDEALKGAREGIELTLKSLLDAFARYNLEQISPADEPFNPELHEAMTMVPVPNVDPNTVIEVLEKGYQLNGRLIRPARVVVSKAP